MKIKIKKDALKLYLQEHQDFGTEQDYWESVLNKIKGKTLEVDTEMLFKYEYNTKPIPGVSEEGIRVPEEYVDKIIDDVRHGKARCEFCEEVSNSIEVCTNCGRSDYLELFFEEDEYA